MTQYCHAPSPIASVPIEGSTARFPVHRIYCIGRNYADHAREMGAIATPEDPIFFMKPADAIVTDGADVPYPSATSDLHHEVELVIALGGGGIDLDERSAQAAMFGYAVGLDLTRRDLQAKAKAKSAPWDVAKGFDASAPIGAIVPVSSIGVLSAGALTLHVNGKQRQHADIDMLLLSQTGIIMHLSRLYRLSAGDLIFTGTPSGVAALDRGDRFEATFPGLPTLTGTMV